MRLTEPKNIDIFTSYFTLEVLAVKITGLMKIDLKTEHRHHIEFIELSFVILLPCGIRSFLLIYCILLNICFPSIKRLSSIINIYQYVTEEKHICVHV